MKRLLVLAAVAVLALAACSDDDGGDVREIGNGGSGSGSGTASGSGSASGVAAECEPVGNADDADTTLDVTLDEFTISLDAEAPAGTVHFAISNEGEEPHEMVIVNGVTVQDLPRDDDGALVESELPDGALVGEVEAFPAGEECDGTFALDPGDYTLLCNLVEEADDGTTESHLAEGMATALTVK
jgi:hypothetical protein